MNGMNGGFLYLIDFRCRTVINRLDFDAVLFQKPTSMTMQNPADFFRLFCYRDFIPDRIVDQSAASAFPYLIIFSYGDNSFSEGRGREDNPYKTCY